jgi:multiple sugar transport system substrate-binding protein
MERVPWNEYIPKLLTECVAGMAPDVILLEVSQVASFTSRHALVDLKPFLEKDPDLKLSDFYPEALRQYTVAGEEGLYAIPRDISPIALIYYNKKKFDEAGIPYPKDDWNYLQFLKAAQKLTKKNAQGRTIQYGFLDDNIMFDAWIYAFGGSITDNERAPQRLVLDSPEAIAGTQFRVDLIYKYKVTPSPASMTAMGGIGNSDQFMNGSVAMLQSGIWISPTLRNITAFDWDAVEFPKGPKGRRGFGMGGAGYALLKGGQHPELAYELAKFFGGEPGQKYMAKTGLCQPALRTLARSPIFVDGQKPKSKGFLVDAPRYGHSNPFDPNQAEWSALVDSALDRVWSGTEKAEPVLKRVTREVNEKFFGKHRQ